MILPDVLRVVSRSSLRPGSVLACVGILLACCGAEPIQSVPLAARAAAEGPLFVRVAPAESGLSFVNELRAENSFPYVNNGSGVAIGDIDGDGQPDVYLVSRDGPNRLFRQVAPFRFEDITARAGVDGGEAWGAGAVFADVDDDGDLDLYVCNTEAPNLLYVNDGTGRFDERGEAFGVAVVAASEMAAFADYDRDGDLDLYVLTNRVLAGDLPDEIVASMRPPADTRKTPAEMAPKLDGVRQTENGWHIPTALRDFVFGMEDQLYFGGQPDRLLRNDGGRFVDVTAEAGIADQGMGLSVTWWDYDDDGWPDIYVANDLESPDQLYHNEGDGTFADVTRRALPQTAYFGMGADVADVDGDGRLDLLVADMSSTTHFKSKWLMGEMGRRRWVLENARPPQCMRNALLRNTGTGRFMEVGRLAGVASTDWTWALKFGDLDNDGLVDLFVTNGIPRFDMNPDIAILLRDSPKSQQVTFARTIQPLPETNLVFRNTGELRFEKASDAWGLHDFGVSQGAAFGDFDRDGDLDLVVNNLGEAAWLYRNQGAAGHRVVVRLRGQQSNRFGVGARVVVETAAGRQLREQTPVRGYLSSDEPMLHFGLGSETEITALEVRWPSGVVQRFAQLAVDRAYEITEAGEPEPPVTAVDPARWFEDIGASAGLTFRHRERPFDDYALQPLLPHRLSQLGPGLAWGDADGDGDDDLWVGGAAGQSGILYRNDGGGAYRAVGDGPWARDSECEDMGACWLDADGDGDLDLFVVSGSIEAEQGAVAYRDRLYRNEGDGRFQKTHDALPALTDSGSVVAAADFDRDGDVDLFVGGRVIPGRFPHAPPSRLLRNDGGKFVDVSGELPANLTEAGMVTAALWSDADNDGWPDLLVAAPWQPVRLWRNDGGRFTSSRPLCASGWWNGLAGADLDGDGDIDYVATNVGLNTKYHASNGHPVSLYADDFDDNGVLDIVEAKYEHDVLFPVRGRSCSSAAMPFLAERFPTYQQFARATLPEIYTESVLAGALHLTATELRSVVLRNRGDGSCDVEPLPRLAQVAPGFGIAISDFDGDGRPDLCLAQNSYSPEPETGRMAGGLGLVLRNRGDHFEVIEPRESGVVIPEDAQAAAVCDVDGDGRPDLAITTSDGPLRVLANRIGPQDGYLAVRLRGPAGNPSAIGARITVRAAGGTQVAEVSAGGGYLSQSSATMFFGGLSDQPAELVVRWPDGSATAHQVAAGTRAVVLTPE